MPEKFEPRDYESYEDLPEEEKENFKKVDDGFVRKEALSEDEALEQAEKMREKIASGEAKDYDEAEFSEEERKEIDAIVANFDFTQLNCLDVLDNIPIKFHSIIADKIIKENHGWHVVVNLDKFKNLDYRKLAWKLIKRGSGYLVCQHLDKLKGLDHNEIALKLIELGQEHDVACYLEKFKRLDHEVALRLIESGKGQTVATYLSIFEGLNYKQIALELLRNTNVKVLVDNLSNFKGLDQEVAIEIWNSGINIDPYRDYFTGEFFIRAKELNLLPSELIYLEDDLDNQENLSRTDLQKYIYRRLIENFDYFHEEGELYEPFNIGIEYFGYDKMFKYIGQEDRHDTLYNFRKIVDLAKKSGLKPEQFFGNILQQVSMDDGQYGEEENVLKSYQYLNNIADAVDIDEMDEILKKAKEYKNIDKLQELAEGFSKKENIFENWKSLKKYYELTQLLGKAEILDELKELKAQGKEKLYRYIETLAFHPNIDMQKVMQFWREPEKFLNIGEIHAPESHERKKPSNYIEIPHLDLTAEDLRDALVEGDLDKLQDWEALEIRYGIGEETTSPDLSLSRRGTLKDEIVAALGSRKKGIKGEAKDPNKLFNELNNIFRKHNFKLMDYLQGDLKLPEKIEAIVNEKLYDEEIGITSPLPHPQRRGDIIEYRAKINFKSDPDGVVAGNDTACCMPFGSGKNNVYTYNPVCALFTAQKKSGDNWRTIAQSVLTKDIDIKKSVSEIINQMEQGMIKLDSLVDEDVLIESDKKITADNVEVASNFKNNSKKDETLKYIYTDFFREYIKKFGEKEKLDKKEMIIGKGHTDAMEDLDNTKNTFIPIAPVGYSDNVEEKALKLDLSKEAGGLDMDKSVDFKTKPSRKDLVELKEKGLEHLTYKDSLQVAYLEGKAYADNASFMEYLHNMENALIAKDINNVRKDRVNLSLKYMDAKGKMQGYIMAYEGNFKKEPIIYVADLAAHPEAKMAGGRLLKGFLELYGDNYIKKDKLTPILADAREKTSYQIILKQAEKMGKELGVRFDVEELWTEDVGGESRHLVLIKPSKE